MRKAVLFLLIFATCALAQHDEAKFWGNSYTGTNIRWGNKFIATDSLRLMPGNLSTTMCDIDNTDTLYTDMMPLPGDGLEGIINITVSFDSVAEDNTSDQDSLKLYVRFYFDKNIHDRHYWENTWYDLNTGMSDETLYIFRDIASDSTWWAPATGWQFKAVRGDADDDTCSAPKLGLYVR